MADLMQQARVLLAAEYERGGIEHVAGCIRHDATLTKLEQRAIRAIAAALRAAPAWQPIETAPRDGTPVWAFNGEQAPMLYIAGEGYALWIWADQVLADVDPSPEQPTHWMPLPEPPLAARPQGVKDAQ